MKTKFKIATFVFALVLALSMFSFSASAPPAKAAVGGGGCPSINAIGNFLPSNDGLAASFSISTVTNPNDTATYTFKSNDESASTGDPDATEPGVPGLIEYCVYPSQPPGNPDGASASYDSWKTVFGSAQGFFSFKRPLGNPTNVPFDGSTQMMGTATWNAGAPTNQAILLHINDADECDQLYGGNPGTCFVFPGSTPPPQPCLGAPACKTVVIDEALTGQPDTVPAFTLLHLHYTYTIVNQASNSFNMIFNPPTPKTLDINSGGGKDYFGCEQKPDQTTASPGGAGTFVNYQGTGFTLKFTLGTGVCDQSRFTLTAPGPGSITLTPGQSVVFTVDMVTRVNKGGKQEYTSCGQHFLNSGFTVKWIQSDDGLLHSFTTNPPISVNVLGC